jgi:hypothetical protein
VPTLCDWKSSRAPKNTRASLGTYPLQIAAYWAAVREMYGESAAHLKRAAVVVGYSSGKAATVHKFEEDELLMLYEQFKLLRKLFAYRYNDDGSAKEET